MINHIRTELLNVAAANAPDAVYIDPLFRPVTVPTWLVKLHQLLLPFASDANQQAYRLAALMQLGHAADYEQFVVLPDPRITYLPADDTTFFASTINPAAALDFNQLYNQVQTEIGRINAVGYNLFSPARRYPSVMVELRAVWTNDLANIGQLTGAVLAVAYQLDNLRA